MEAPPAEAQAQFRDQIGAAFDRMGFRLVEETPGQLTFAVRYLGGVRWFFFIPVVGWALFALWLWRKVSAQRIEVGLVPADSGTTVAVYGKAAGDVAGLVNLLGRQGHWPSNREDPDWIAEGAGAPGDDPYRAWDEVGDIDPTELDRTTRRALRKAGKLPNG